MAGKTRPSLRHKTLHNILLSNLSETDKKCIEDVFKAFEEQEAEIERLESEYPCKVKCGNNCEIWAKSLSDYDNLIGDISAEGIKEFAEELKEKAYRPSPYPYIEMVTKEDIDNLVKEKVGDAK